MVNLPFDFIGYSSICRFIVAWIPRLTQCAIKENNGLPVGTNLANIESNQEGAS
jgi:hypothetical protein